LDCSSGPSLASIGRLRSALAGFVSGRTLSSKQIEFIDLIIDYLTDRGVMDPRRLYESPFTDVDDQGVSGVFTPTEVKILVDTLAQVRAKAAA
jgi:type I restriction enzyme, R subunit